MECRSVHEERPSSSTSGGHSLGARVEILVNFLDWEVISLRELHARQLSKDLVLTVGAGRGGRDYGLPSFPRIMLLGNRFVGSAVDPAAVVAVLVLSLSRVSSAIVFFVI